MPSGRHDEAHNRFSQLCERAYNPSVQVSSGGVIFVIATSGVADANQAFGTRLPGTEVRSPFATAR
jgi:hypothetical protein